MKTNKQRAEIVLEKAKQIKSQNSNQTQPLQKTFSKKQKTIFATCIASFVCVIASVFVLVFSLGGANNFDINNMFIANFENYTALGAGYFEKSNTGAVYADEDTPSKQYLLGLTSDGKVEKIKIKTQEGDEVIEQTWELRNFRAFSNYSIACFRYHDNTTPLGEFFGNYDTERTYVIDNKTGKFFSLENLPHNYFAVLNQAYFYDGNESQTKLFVWGGYTNAYNELYTLYQLEVVGGNLKVEKVFSASDFEGLFKLKYTFVDVYGNVFLTNSYPRQNNNFANVFDVNYCISGGSVKAINQKLYRNLNGIVYTEDNTKQIDKNGNLTDNTKQIPNVFLENEIMIKRLGNVEYYYGLPVREELHNDDGYFRSKNNEQKKYVYKITWKNSTEYTCEIINIEGIENFDLSGLQYVVTSDKIYFRDSTEIFVANTYDGKTQKLTSEYIFKNIKTDNLGNVVFEATGSNLESITGTINNNGQISILTQKPTYEVYYIKPIKFH